MTFFSPHNEALHLHHIVPFNEPRMISVNLNGVECGKEREGVIRSLQSEKTYERRTSRRRHDRRWSRDPDDAISNKDEEWMIPTRENVTWEPDANASRCRRCDAPFNVFQRRRHHCRACGKIFCHACSRYEANILGYLTAQRVCRACYGRFRTGFRRVVMVPRRTPEKAKKTRRRRSSNDEDCLNIPTIETHSPSLPFALRVARGVKGNDRCVACSRSDPEWICVLNGIAMYVGTTNTILHAPSIDHSRDDDNDSSSTTGASTVQVPFDRSERTSPKCALSSWTRSRRGS